MVMVVVNCSFLHNFFFLLMIDVNNEECFAPTAHTPTVFPYLPWRPQHYLLSPTPLSDEDPKMMTRPCVLALLGVALLCGFVAGQEQGAGASAAPTGPVTPATPKKPDASTTAEPSPEPSSDTDPKAEAEPEAEPESEPEPESDDTKAKSAAPIDDDEDDDDDADEAEMEGKVMNDEEEGNDDEEDEDEEEEEDYVENEEVADAEASSSENGAALVSVSLPSLVLAAVLAKVFAH